MVCLGSGAKRHVVAVFIQNQILLLTGVCMYGGSGERQQRPPLHQLSALSRLRWLKRRRRGRLTGSLKERLQKQYFVDEQHDIISFHNTAPFDSALPPCPTRPGPAQPPNLYC